MLRSKTITFCKVLILLLVINGCTPTSKITYLNDSQLKEWNVSTIPPKHHLEIGDIILVRVISRNEESNNLFNLETNTNSSNRNLTAAHMYLNGLTISQEGTIDIPNVGEVSVLNQTLEEAEETILLKAEEFLINPFVIVKLANFQFTTLGEINMPGNYPVYKEGLTIYDPFTVTTPASINLSASLLLHIPVFEINLFSLILLSSAFFNAFFDRFSDNCLPLLGLDFDFPSLFICLLYTSPSPRD